MAKTCKINKKNTIERPEHKIATVQKKLREIIRSLKWGVVYLVATYGLLGGISVALTMVPSVLIPLSWFPDHRGKISGIVFAGFGLSASVFSGLQSVLINPSNLAPKQEERCQGETSCPAYFDQAELLHSLPFSMVMLSVIYTGLLIPGLLLVVERPKEVLQFKNMLLNIFHVETIFFFCPQDSVSHCQFS